MDYASINRKVDLSIVVSIACILVLLSLLILILDNWKRLRDGRQDGLAELIVAHLMFLSSTLHLALNDRVYVWLNVTLILSGVIGGIIAGFLSVLSLLGLPPRRAPWVAAWVGITLFQCGAALTTGSIPFLLLTSSAINGALSGWFAWAVWKQASLQAFGGRALLALPFAAISAAFLARLGLLLGGAPNAALLLSTAIITYVLAFSVFLWVFATSSVRAFRLNRSLDWAARHDPLTGLENRRSLAELSAKRSGGERTGEDGNIICSCIDLDDFKQINDTHGHQVGDTVLQVVAARLRAMATGPRDRIFRIGGDEFVLWQAVGAAVDVEQHMAAMLGALCAEIDVGAGIIRPSVSIGYCDSRAALPVEDRIRRADTALYLSKGNGRGRFTAHQDPPLPGIAPALLPGSAPAPQDMLSRLC
ncbi:GGDEF domain-containing protein [Paroceanicella profunda]|uniref:diguanylate cyclase n=1 Tax=Paroceanicella profunda TaxID=2579971 RepID=A0A5B8FS15_9RHOB|nr:GGDEF domain-containing protein [Paroceanicella profunda]QDL91556.1 GGDEF domain-containing protein [Paroceanicella profunda]